MSQRDQRCRAYRLGGALEAAIRSDPTMNGQIVPNKIKALSIFGTRPEAIKMAPVIAALSDHPRICSRVCVTAQHREMLDQVLSFFGIQPHHDLNTMRTAQDLTDITTSVLNGLRSVLESERPDIVLVHGDTTTTLAASLAAFYHGAQVAHVEAGLRTGNKHAPWPEEVNRVLADAISDFHFAPTVMARDNLIRQGIDPSSIHVTGNTVIDALNNASARLRANNALRSAMDEALSIRTDENRIILVTCHRRESLGGGIQNLCSALAEIVRERDVTVVFPVHPNPKVREVVTERLSGIHKIRLCAPLDYPQFVHLLNRCAFVITDSGGIQEEAPSIGRPVLVIRDTTERPEALAAGGMKLVGTQRDQITKEALSLLDDAQLYRAMATPVAVYGDGRASLRIADIIATHFRNEQLKEESARGDA